MKIDDFRQNVDLSVHNQLAALNSLLTHHTLPLPSTDVTPPSFDFVFRDPVCSYMALPCCRINVIYDLAASQVVLKVTTCPNTKKLDVPRIVIQEKRHPSWSDELFGAKLVFRTVTDIISSLRFLFPQLSPIKVTAAITDATNHYRLQGVYEVKVFGCKSCAVCQAKGPFTHHYAAAVDPNEAVTTVGSTATFCASPTDVTARITY